MRGVVLIALGHPYYGRMAHNLAMSLKYSCPELHITLAHNNTSITHLKEHLGIFDTLVEVPEEYYTKNGNKEFLKAKTFIYNLSPYDETIFLDVDMIWTPKRSISLLFEELKDIDFTIQCRGSKDINSTGLTDYSMWANVEEIREKYKISEGKYCQIASEFIYFKKGKKIKKLFSDAAKVYDTLKVQNKVFAGAIPDELVFSISMMLNDIYPHKDNYVPIYWEAIEKQNLPLSKIYDNYYGYSIGGASASNGTKKIYNNLVSFFGKQYGIQHHFTLKEKRSFLIERRNA